MKKGRILVVGSLVMDLITATKCFPQSGATVLGASFSTAPGGKGANQAVQAARLGADVTMVGRVGVDAFGETLIDSARKAGIHVGHIAREETEPSAIGNIILEAPENGSTQNRIIVVPGANMKLDEGDIAHLAEDITSYDAVMLQLEIPMAVNEQVAALAHRAGVSVILNPAPAAALSDEIIRNTTYLAPNESEATALTGLPIGRSGDTVDLADAERVAKALLQRGTSCVILTLGSAGALYARDGNTTFVPAVPGVKVADPTAAGDSFLGAFAAAVSAGFSDLDAVRFANCVAAVTVSKHGAQPSLPALETVLPLLAGVYGHSFAAAFTKGQKNG